MYIYIIFIFCSQMYVKFLLHFPIKDHMHKFLFYWSNFLIVFKKRKESEVLLEFITFPVIFFRSRGSMYTQVYTTNDIIFHHRITRLRKKIDYPCKICFHTQNKFSIVFFIYEKHTKLCFKSRNNVDLKFLMQYPQFQIFHLMYLKHHKENTFLMQ